MGLFACDPTPASPFGRRPYNSRVQTENMVSVGGSCVWTPASGATASLVWDHMCVTFNSTPTYTALGIFILYFFISLIYFFCVCLEPHCMFSSSGTAHIARASNPLGHCVMPKGCTAWQGKGLVQISISDK